MEEIEDKPNLNCGSSPPKCRTNGVPHHLTVGAGRDRNVPPRLGDTKVPQPLVIGKFNRPRFERHCTSVRDGEIGRY